MKHLYTWLGVVAIVVTSSAGDVLLSRAMKKIGDIGQLRKHIGILGVAREIVCSGTFLGGLLAMALAFFSLIWALSWADVSLVAPASASLSFVTTALAGKFILHEHVDRRRWLAALLACAGVALLAA